MADAVGSPLEALSGHTKLLRTEELESAEVVAILVKNQSALGIDPLSRSFHKRFLTEHTNHVKKFTDLSAALKADEAAVDEMVFDLYEVTAF